MWKSVAREARWIAVLAPLAMADLRKEWSTQVNASDAAPSGIAVAVSDWTEAEVRAVGEVSERWRYVSGCPKARESALSDQAKDIQSRDVFNDPDTVLPMELRWT